MTSSEIYSVLDFLRCVSPPFVLLLPVSTTQPSTVRQTGTVAEEPPNHRLWESEAETRERRARSAGVKRQRKPPLATLSRNHGRSTRYTASLSKPPRRVSRPETPPASLSSQPPRDPRESSGGGIPQAHARPGGTVAHSVAGCQDTDFLQSAHTSLRPIIEAEEL